MDVFVANTLADAAAAGAAERVQCSAPGFSEVQKWEAYLYLVACRLATIEVFHWAQGDEEPPPAPPLPEWQPVEVRGERSDIDSRIRERGHALRVECGKVICSRCHRRRMLKKWIGRTKLECVPRSSGRVATLTPCKKEIDEACADP